VLVAAERRRWLGRDDVDAMASRTRGEATARVGSRRLLRRLVAAEVVRVEPQHLRVDVRCPQCGSATHGPPTVRTARGGRLVMSTSSAAERVAIVLAPVSVGVDVVRRSELRGLGVRSMERHAPAAKVVQQACSPTVGAPELWTAVEALSKTTSHGLVADLAQVREALASHQLHWTHHDPDHVSCLASRVPIEAFDMIDTDLQAELLTG
jgi:hypothetical protein